MYRMSLAVVMNSNQVSNTSTNTQFTYKFINGALEIPPNSTMTIATCQIPYAFPNITPTYANQTFVIQWPSVGATPITDRLYTIPKGFYLVSDISNWLTAQFVAQGLYLLDPTGNIVTYVTMSYNTTLYAIQLNCYAIPTSLPAGYSNPAGMLFPATASTPLFSIPNGITNYIYPVSLPLGIVPASSLGTLLGYVAGTFYPPVVQATNYSTTGSLTPLGSNVNSLILRCNLIANDVTMPSDILGSFPINASYGSNITFLPSFEIKMKLKPGRYNQMTIQLVDQNFNTIYSLDPNVLMTFLMTLGDQTRK